MRRVRARVSRILSYRKLGISDHEREDLEQEIMAELWQSVNKAGFDFTAGFWGFVEVVVSRRCIDWLRSRRGLVPVVVDIQDPHKDPFDRVLESERSKLAERILGALEPECRDLVRMRLHDGMSYGDIAQVLGRNEGALRVQMHRCIRNAQRLLAELHPSAQARGRERRDS